MIAFALLLCWALIIRSDPKDHPWISPKELEYIKSNIVSNDEGQEKNKKFVPWLKIFTSVPVIATVTVKFTINWNFMLMLLKLPSYLQTVLKYPVDQVRYLIILFIVYKSYSA